MTEWMPQVRSVSLGVWLQVGSRDEGGGEEGICHFIEHLVFKGTERRTAKQIAQEIDAVGGSLDAFTTREHTCFYGKVLGKHVPLAVDVLADLLLRPRLDPEDIEMERGVILQEIKMVEDTPDDLIHDLFTQAVWPSHPLGHSVLGRRETLERIGRDDLVNFMDRYYCPSRTIVAAAGDLDHDQLADLLAEAFTSWEGRIGRAAAQPPTTRYAAVNKDRNLSQIHFCYGVAGLPYAHKDRYTLHLLNSVVGGGMSSRLFQEVREKRGLVYSIYSYAPAYRDTGLFVVYAGTSSDQYHEVLDLIRAECEKLRREGVIPEELCRAKEQLKGGLLLGLESTGSRMTRLAAMQMYFGHCFALDEIVQGIEAVTPPQLQHLVDMLFGGEAYALASIGRIPPGSPRPVNGA
ncbi:MAG: M16 family metallopeptidase [Candidatus Methylomirabilales bacterium]